MYSSNLSVHILQRQDIKKFIPLARDAHKNIAGHVWIFGGSIGFTGAPRLAARGAFAAAAGLVSLCCPAKVHNIIATACLETMVHIQSEQQPANCAQNADVIIAGPGWGIQQQDCLYDILQSKLSISLVLDADALNILAADNNLRNALKQRQYKCQNEYQNQYQNAISPEIGICVLTPHPGEAARLLDCSTAEIQADRVGAVSRLAQYFDCVIILKGINSLIAIPASIINFHKNSDSVATKPIIYLCPFGSPSLAVAGSGDVLAGILAALLVRHGKNAPCLAVLLHALAGERMEHNSSAWLASDIATMVRKELLETLWDKN